MACLQELNGGRKIPLPSKITVIGRDRTCDIVVSAEQASRRHALILQAGGAYYVEDLDSANGTFVNGQGIQQRTRLQANDRLELPGLQATFHPDELPAPPEPKRATVRPAEQAPAVTATAGAPSITSSVEVAGEQRVQVEPEAKLRAILEISRNLAKTLNLKEVLPKILESLFTIFPQADHGFILLRDPSSGNLVPSAVQTRRGVKGDTLRVSRTILNHVLRTRRAVLSADAGQDERFDASQSIKGLHIRSIMCVPLLSQEGGNLGVIQIATQDRRQPFRQEDLEVLASASVQAARAVELARLHQEQRDLEAATQIQKSFLPHDRPQVPGLRFFDHYMPARHVGGDYYDYIPLPGNRLAVALGDVSGHGVSAALLMARLSTAVRFSLATAPTVAEAVRQMSVVLTRAGSEDRYVTFVVAVLDLSTFSMTLVNAGHLPPLRRKANGTVEEVGEPLIGLPLAVIDRPYEELVEPLEPGDTLVLFTDGVTEARNPPGELYGPERLRAAVAASPADPEVLGLAILADVGRFAGDRPQGDDLTLVCFGREP